VLTIKATRLAVPFGLYARFSTNHRQQRCASKIFSPSLSATIFI